MIRCRCSGPDIVPGMTFEQRFFLPVPAYQIVMGTVIYQQLGEEKLELQIGENATVEAVNYATSAIVVQMTQGRSLVFRPLIPAEVQINFLTPMGTRVVTNIMRLRVGQNMDAEIMTESEGDNNG